MKQSKNTRNERSAALLAAGVILLLLISYIVFSVTQLRREDKVSPTPSPTTTSQAPAAAPTKRSLSGKTPVQDQKDALAAAQKLLSEAGVSPTKVSAAERVSLLDKKDFSVVNEATKNAVKFPATAPDYFRAQTYQTLITLNELITSSQKTKVTSSPAAYESVLVDSETGIAQVPVSLFSQRRTAFSMTMVYVDEEWRLYPYPLLESVQLSAALLDATTQQSPSPSATR